LVFVIGVTIVKPIVGEVAPGSAAARGGFVPGDVIVAVDDKPIDAWQSAELVLLDKALGDNAVQVKVRDTAGVERDRTLDLKSVEKELKQGNMLEILGVKPLRPVIKAVIGKLETGEPAERAGLNVGDLIVSCAGRAIPDWETWVDCVRNHAGQRIRVGIDRNGEHIQLEIEPRLQKSKDGDYGYVGAGVALPDKDEFSQLLSVTRYSPLKALGKAAEKTWDMSALTLRMLWGMVDGRVSISNISGPISIAKYAGYSAHAGGTAFLTFLAIISLSLGVLNFLPIPVLDGGHLFYYLIEIVKGSPLSDAAQLLGQRIGIAALLILMAIAFYNDIAQFIG
jgi:regulator of sigma E protease